MGSELEELDDLEEMELDYDEEFYWNELVLFASIILKTGEDYLFIGASTEYRNIEMFKLVQWCCNTRDYRRESHYIRQIWIADRLPDVCGACFLSFGLTVGGRYRFSCPECKGKETRIAIERWTSLGKLSLFFKDEVWTQLIYKYYSPNGDPSWEMKKYNLWKF